MNRRSIIYHGTDIISDTMLDVSWNELRSHRDELLSKSDWRFMSDQTPSQEWIDYRQFLRDLPQNYPGELANDACDALEAYTKPE
jgi:hypothetical protein